MLVVDAKDRLLKTMDFALEKPERATNFVQKLSYLANYADESALFFRLRDLAYKVDRYLEVLSADAEDDMAKALKQVKQGTYPNKVETILTHDFADHSFGFSVNYPAYEAGQRTWKRGICGGLIYHRAEDQWGTHT